MPRPANPHAPADQGWPRGLEQPWSGEGSKRVHVSNRGSSRGGWGVCHKRGNPLPVLDHRAAPHPQVQDCTSGSSAVLPIASFQPTPTVTLINTKLSRAPHCLPDRVPALQKDPCDTAPPLSLFKAQFPLFSEASIQKPHPPWVLLHLHHLAGTVPSSEHLRLLLIH